MQIKHRILTIEDDAAIRRGIVDALRFAGFEPIEACDAASGSYAAIHDVYDVLLLDLVLPGSVDGFEILRSVRRSRPRVPVIILSARGEEADRVRGLKEGADDYVVKPFSVRELLARVEAVMRRTAERPLDVDTVAIPGGVVDLARAEARFAEGSRVALSEKEVDLVRYLAGSAARVVSREELLNNVWGISPRNLSTRTIDMHIARLREKIERDRRGPAVVVTVRGRGYKWGCQVDERFG